MNFFSKSILLLLLGSVCSVGLNAKTLLYSHNFSRSDNTKLTKAESLDETITVNGFYLFKNIKNIDIGNSWNWLSAYKSKDLVSGEGLGGIKQASAFYLKLNSHMDLINEDIEISFDYKTNNFDNSDKVLIQVVVGGVLYQEYLKKSNNSKTTKTFTLKKQIDSSNNDIVLYIKNNANDYNEEVFVDNIKINNVTPVVVNLEKAGVEDLSVIGYENPTTSNLSSGACLETNEAVLEKVVEIKSNKINNSNINLCAGKTYHVDLNFSMPSWLYGLTIQTVPFNGNSNKAILNGKIHTELLRVFSLKNLIINSDEKDDYSVVLNNVDNSNVENVEINSFNNGILGSRIDGGINLKNLKIISKLNGINITGGSGSVLNSNFTYNGVTYDSNTVSNIENVFIAKNESINEEQKDLSSIGGKGIYFSIDKVNLRNLEIYSTLNALEVYNSAKNLLYNSKLFSVVNNGLSISNYQGDASSTFEIKGNYIHSQQNIALYLSDTKFINLNHNFLLSESEDTVKINSNVEDNTNNILFSLNCFQSGAMKKFATINEKTTNVDFTDFDTKNGNFYDLGLEANNTRIVCRDKNNDNICDNDFYVTQNWVTDFIDFKAHKTCNNDLLDRTSIPNELTNIIDVNPTANLIFTDSLKNSETGLTIFSKNKKSGNTNTNQRINVLIIGDNSGSMNATVPGTGKTRLTIQNEAIKNVILRYKDISDLRFSTIKLWNYNQPISSTIQDWSNETVSFNYFGSSNNATYYDTAITNTINQLNKIKSDSILKEAEKTIVYFISDGEATDDFSSNIGNLKTAVLSNPSVYKFYTIAIGVDGGDLKTVSLPTEDSKTPPPIKISDANELEAVMLSTINSLVEYSFEDIDGYNLSNELFLIDSQTGNITLKDVLTEADLLKAQNNAGLSGEDFEGSFFYVGVKALDKLNGDISKNEVFKIYLSNSTKIVQEPLVCDTFKNAIQTRNDCSTGMKDLFINSSSASVINGVNSKVYACGYDSGSANFKYGTTGKSSVYIDKDTTQIQKNTINYYNPANIYIPEYISYSVVNEVKTSNGIVNCVEDKNQISFSSNISGIIENNKNTLNVNSIKVSGSNNITLKNGIFQINDFSYTAGATNISINTLNVEELKINKFSIPKNSIVDLSTSRKVYIEELNLVEGVNLTINTDEIKIKKLKTTGTNSTIKNLILNANKIEIEEIEMSDSSYDVIFKNYTSSKEQELKNNSLIFNSNITFEFANGNYYFNGFVSNFSPRNNSTDVIKAQPFSSEKFSKLYFNQSINFINNNITINKTADEGDNSINLQFFVNGDINMTGNSSEIEALLYLEGILNVDSNFDLMGAISSVGIKLNTGSYDFNFSELLKTNANGGLCSNTETSTLALDNIVFFDEGTNYNDNSINTKISNKPFTLKVGFKNEEGLLENNPDIEFNFSFYGEEIIGGVSNLTKISNDYTYRASKLDAQNIMTENISGLGNYIDESDSIEKAKAFKKVVIGIEACTTELINNGVVEIKIYPYNDCSVVSDKTKKIYYMNNNNMFFALRPNKIKIEVFNASNNIKSSNSNRVIAGDILNLKLTPLSFDDLEITNYVENIEVSVSKGDNTMNVDGLIKNDTVAYTNMISDYKSGNNVLRYNEVGLAKIKVEENNSFSSIDNIDLTGSIVMRTIPENNEIIGRFAPHHFTITKVDLVNIIGNTTISNTCRYNYINKSSENLTTFKYALYVEARNLEDTLTRNYDGLYAFDTNFTYDYVWNTNIGSVNEAELGVSSPTNSLSFNNVSINHFDNSEWVEGKINTSNIFDVQIDILNGVNVDRNTPLEPFVVNLRETNNFILDNILMYDTDGVQASETVDEGNREYSNTAQPTTITYVYGRLNPIDAYSTEGGDAELNIYYEIYGSIPASTTLLGSSGLKINPTGGNLNESVNDSSWWQNFKHSECDTNLSYNINYTGVSNTDISFSADYSNPQRDVLTYTLDGTINRPITILGDIDLNLNTFLYHNSTYNNNSEDRFKIEFVPIQEKTNVLDSISNDNSNIIKSNKNRFTR